MTDWKALCESLVDSFAPNLSDDESAVALEVAMDAILDALDKADEDEAEIGPEWRSCRKLPVIVHVREQRTGEQHVSTREGITPLKPDDLIIRGVQGEEYPIGRELFHQTYELIND